MMMLMVLWLLNSFFTNNTPIKTVLCCFCIVLCSSYSFSRFFETFSYILFILCEFWD